MAQNELIIGLIVKDEKFKNWMVSTIENNTVVLFDGESESKSLTLDSLKKNFKW